MANFFSLKQCIYSSTLDKNSIFYCGDEEAKLIGGNVPGDDYTPDRPDLEQGTIITNINNLMNKCVNPIKSHEIFNWVIDQGIDFDQMIWEFPEKGNGINGSWVHISYKSGNNRKKTSLASKSSALHKKYGGVQIGEYQHDIKRAYPEYIMEESENTPPPVSKHPNADQVEPNRGYYYTKKGPRGNVVVKDDDMNIIYTGGMSSGSPDELINEAKNALTT